MLVGFIMLPVPPSMDIRGWNEMYPLDGPGWSLFFEYIANILYGTIVRKFSKAALSIFVFLSACLLIQLAVFGERGDVIGGWSLEPAQLHIGFARVMYPFFAGLLLCRTGKIIQVKNAFLWCSLLIITALSIPRFGGTEHLWMNGIYESVVIVFIFPLIVYLGAGGKIKGKYPAAICKFFADISYPVYITHYPLIYICTSWIAGKKLTFSQAVPVALLVFISSVIIAYACLKLYDEPVRRWLSHKILR